MDEQQEVIVYEENELDEVKSLDLLMQEVTDKLEGVESETPPAEFAWVLLELGVNSLIKHNGTLFALQMMCNLMSSVLQNGPEVELQLKRTH